MGCGSLACYGDCCDGVEFYIGGRLFGRVGNKEPFRKERVNTQSCNWESFHNVICQQANNVSFTTRNPPLRCFSVHNIGSTIIVVVRR